MSDKKNPMFGRTGDNHPMFGKTGDNHPMFSRTGKIIQRLENLFFFSEALTKMSKIH
jgi:hypothetical protein